MHNRRQIGLGPANVVRGLIFTVAVHLITGAVFGSVLFLIFYLFYTLWGQILGLENME